MPLITPGNPKIEIEIDGKVKDILDKIKQVDKSLDEFAASNRAAEKAAQQAAQKSKLSWTDFRSMYQTVLDVVRFGQQVWAATVGELIKYGDQVQKLKTITGQSAEETSRQIQLADDLRVSYEALSISLRFASKNGIDTSIEGLANLSDEYRKLQPGIDRTQFLMKNFGRSGIEMAKILEMDSAALREMAAATADGLIVNEQDLADIKELNRNIDNLTDAWAAFKMEASKDSLPVLTAGLKELNSNIEESGTLLGIFRFGFDDLFRAIKNGKKATDEQTDSIENTGEAADAAALSIAEMEEAELAAQQAAQELSSSLQGMLGLIMNLQSENDNYTEKMGELRDKHVELMTAQREFMQGSDEWWEYQEKISETGAAINELAAEHEEAGKKIAFSLLQAKAAVDGFTQAEFDGLLKIGMQWGILDQQTVDAATSMDAEMQKLIDDMDGTQFYANGATTSVEKFDAATKKMADGSLPDANKELSRIVDQLFVAKANQGTYTYKYVITGTGSFPTPPGGTGGSSDRRDSKPIGGGGMWGYAEGTKGWETVPPGYPNDSFPVALTSGEKYAVIPNGGGGSATKTTGGSPIVLNFSSLISLADQRDFEYKITPVIERVVRRAQGLI